MEHGVEGKISDVLGKLVTALQTVKDEMQPDAKTYDHSPYGKEDEKEEGKAEMKCAMCGHTEECPECD